MSSLAYDPLTRRVLFTSFHSHAVHAIDSSSHVSIVVGSKDEEGSQQGTCPAAEARFKWPRVAVDGDGNYVISDEYAHMVPPKALSVSWLDAARRATQMEWVLLPLSTSQFFRASTVPEG